MGFRRRSFADHCPEEKIISYKGFALPPAPPYAPFHALSSVMKLLVNKEDTRQVFEIVGALAGNSHNRFFQRFVDTDYGSRVVQEPVRVEEILGRRDWLRSLPEGSVGRAYLAFMEGEDLTPDGILLAANEAGIDYSAETQFAELRRMSIHFDVVHDLWHVLTGYGRDTLGELCLLIYTREQVGSPGLRLITWIGAAAGKLEKPAMPILRAMKEARLMGQKSAWIPGVDIEELLLKPLQVARDELGLINPTIYRSIPSDWKNTLLPPRVKQTQSQREQAA